VAINLVLNCLTQRSIEVHEDEITLQRPDGTKLAKIQAHPGYDGMARFALVKPKPPATSRVPLGFAVGKPKPPPTTSISTASNFKIKPFSAHGQQKPPPVLKQPTAKTTKKLIPGE
jgi:hypothetical protein